MVHANIVGFSVSLGFAIGESDDKKRLDLDIQESVGLVEF